MRIKTKKMKIRIAGFKWFLFPMAAAVAAAILPGVAAAQVAGHTSAEVDPLSAEYFQNQYLGNPSMAGVDSALNINAAYRTQSGSVPGAPVTKALTADGYIGHHVGLGLTAYNDQAGLFNRTKVGLTYAYHAQIGRRGQQLHFGVSLTYADNRIDPAAVDGDQSDPTIGKYNGRTNHFEVDYGMAYTDLHWTLQAVLPNIVSYMLLYPDDIQNRSTFLMAASYRFLVGGALEYVEPKVMYRGVQGLNNIVDMGVNLVFLHHILNVFGMAHTTKNYTVGAGLHYKNTLSVRMAYTSQASGLANYFDGNYEVGVGLTLFRHK
jgi:type IX secretion system PorP/SprF family membrane protein